MWVGLWLVMTAWADDTASEPPRPLDLETRVRVYGDVGVSARSQHRPLGFTIGDAVLAYSSALDRTAEIKFDAIFGMDQHGDWLAMVDRVLFDLHPTDAVTLTVGKFYLPVGYWNTNIPYGGWLYPTQYRPAMLEFERHGAAIPVHQTGIDVHAIALAGYWQLGVHLGTGNGRSPHLTETQDIGDGGFGKALWLQAYVESPGGVQIGASTYYDDRIQVGHLAMDLSENFGDVSDVFMTDHVHHDQVILQHDTREFILAGHLAWTGHPTELLAEGMLVMHERVRTQGQKLVRPSDTYKPVWNYNGYVQLSHAFNRVTPYARVDSVEFWHSDPLYRDLGRVRLDGQVSAGTRFDFLERAAVKAELSAMRNVVFEQVNRDRRVDNRFGAGLYIVAGF